ncbi:hypothetical protein VTN00DRAFT_1167 [Thermoascus crustaceus]|uniref:uncharacterized protein n=1 Tax=Thermoascus crustaceus TaxID=5088 RepID=UPI00374490FB
MTFLLLRSFFWEALVLYVLLIVCKLLRRTKAIIFVFAKRHFPPVSSLSIAGQMLSGKNTGLAFQHQRFLSQIRVSYR